MSTHDGAIIPRPQQAALVRGEVLRAFLEAAEAGPGAVLGALTVRTAALEGDHVRFELTGPPRDLVLLARARDDGAAFRRGERWLVSYRGRDFTKADEPALIVLLERLEAAATAQRLDADALRAGVLRKPQADDYLEVSPGKKLYVRVTDHCDEKCVFCNATEGNANIVPSKSDAETILRELPVGALTQVIFSGGEPTLVKSLPRLVGLAYERGARDIIVQTNGVALGAPGAVDTYLPYRDRLGLGFSLHATDPALSAELLDVPDLGRFSLKLAAIDRAVELGFRTKVTCVVVRPNLAQVPAFARWAWARWGKGLKRLQFSYAMPRGNAWLNRHQMASFTECVPLFTEAFELGRRTGLRVETSQSSSMPPCVMPDYIDHYDIYGDFSGGRTASTDRAKPAACNGCQWDRLCAGVWTRYLEVYGDGELKAVTDRPDPGMPIEDYLEAEVLSGC
jgi:molybdenum cofactor biosynthesis enzyme MoaA